MINPVQYIILNKCLDMSTGKAAAQAAHASVEGVRVSAKEPGENPWDAHIVNLWYRGKHYAKVVLETTDDMHTVKHYLEERGIKAVLIIDEGRTEFDGGLTATAIGTEILNKNDTNVQATMSGFGLYKDRPKPVAKQPRFRRKAVIVGKP